ncbi:orotidine-5'-phosphate decarboxylase [Jeotgalibacillus sp. R-1-5s-1]|uniref:orotidine-5'-phosphate decarboxylase n=1 Tax=Jeotgalibacillus sp. R-1-5s-1 TaxID=2555897 RepID=UPI001069E672|nr:orotidine-5'-phosphate decarboxylase [Jeotgalibacillus sp. R-1-5s-1]TFE03552.1 orotidine-5'-phosphate decarboxylase [Jeotgalibacillus sp. R-1-5s-1]
MEKQPVIALDFAEFQEAEHFLNQFAEPLYVKVGMELFYQNGPSMLYQLKEKGHRIFLDLKLHDIPTTVRKAMKGLASLEVDLVNVHAAGGQAMMEAAREGLAQGASGVKRPSIIAVTQLTSTSEHQMRSEQNIQTTLIDSVVHYASLAKKSGMDGVVCSPKECKAIESAIGEPFIRLTPGIRPAGGDLHDQVRIASPKEAQQLGSTAIVVGRAITQSEDPVQAYYDIKKEWSGLE